MLEQARIFKFRYLFFSDKYMSKHERFEADDDSATDELRLLRAQFRQNILKELSTTKNEWLSCLNSQITLARGWLDLTDKSSEKLYDFEQQVNQLCKKHINKSDIADHEKERLLQKFENILDEIIK